MSVQHKAVPNVQSSPTKSEPRTKNHEKNKQRTNNKFKEKETPQNRPTIGKESHPGNRWKRMHHVHINEMEKIPSSTTLEFTG